MAKGSRVASAVLSSANGRQTGALSPMVQILQQQQQGFDINKPYRPLARPADLFLSGAFGPLSPIQAMPIDVPRDDSGRPDPRRFQVPIGWNLPIGQPGSEGLKLAPFVTLRSAADMYSVARSCIDHRKNEIISMGWDIVPTFEQTQVMKGDPAAREDWEKRRKQAVEFFKHPDSDRGKYPTMEAWLNGLLEDRFVIDAMAVHFHQSRGKGGGPFGSDLAALDLLDGSTIRPMLDTKGQTPRGGAVAFQQYMWGVPRVDLASVFLGDDLDGLGEPEATFTSDQLLYMRDDPRNGTPYGFSPVEKAMVPILIGWSRQMYQNDYFQEGSVPASFITPGPEVATAQQIRQLQDALNAMAGDIGAKHRMIVLPSGSKVDPQKPHPLADQFDEWIVSQVCMPFMLTPMDLGVTPRVSAIQSPAESKQLSNINTQKGSEARLKPVLNQLKSDLFDYVLQVVFKQEDMEWYWGDPTDGDEQDSNVIDNSVTLVSNGLETIDEARISMGKAPYGLPETSVPGIKTATGYMPLQVAVQAAVQSVAGASGAPGASGAAPLAGKPGQPKPPGQGQQQAAQQPQEPPKYKPIDLTDVLSTPAHEAVQSAAGATPPGAHKSLTAELAMLNRYLRNGKPISKFRADVLTEDAMRAAEADLPKGTSAAVNAAARRMGHHLRASRRSARLTAAIHGVASKLTQLVIDHRNGDIGSLGFVDAATKAMADGYATAMQAGSEDASADYPDTPVKSFDAEVAARAQRQQGFLMNLLGKANLTVVKAAGDEEDDDPSDLDDMASRFMDYGETLVGSYNAAFGQTVEDAHPDYEIVWELGDAEHCDLCTAREGEVYTFDTLPGWPGDGDFGGDLCDGGPRCACTLSYQEGGEVLAEGENTQREDSLDYYDGQNADITQRREDMAAARDEFVSGLPGDREDLSTPQARAFERDEIRDATADYLNDVIQQDDGYQGVTVEPSDISADFVADRTTKGYNPDQMRDERGRWTSGGGSAKDTFEKYTDSNGRFTPDRAALHDQIVSRALAGHEASDHPTATFLGGGPASGKSTILASIGDDHGVHIDADEVKAQIPEYRAMTEAGDPRAAAYAHEESSYVAKQIMRESISQRSDFMLDGTGDSTYENMAKKVGQAKAAGYTTHGAYVTVNTDEAVRRANARGEATGRVVPETVVRSIHASVSSTFRDAISHDLFDKAELWDTNGAKPLLVGSKAEGGRWTVHDQGAWQSFLSKADS